jgi:hypothetical protein
MHPNGTIMVTKSISNLIDRIASKITPKTDREVSARADETTNDLSYEDALLDVEIRSFMRAEYGKKGPPNGVFPRVMQAIQLYREEQAKAAPRGLAASLTRIAGSLGQTIVTTYKLGARLDAGRIVSGSLITAIVLLAVWPGMARSLSSGGQLGQYIDVLSGGAASAPGLYSTGAETAESPTSTSASSSVPTPLPAGSGASTTTQSNYMTPGRIYDDPRLLLAQRIGEDPNELKKHSNKQATDGSTGNDEFSQNQPELNHNRPISGQD